MSVAISYSSKLSSNTQPLESSQIHSFFISLCWMDRAKDESPEGIGSVKAAISLYGERIHGKKQLQRDSMSKTGELHLAKLDVGKMNETKKVAEEEKARAESELHKARTAAKELAFQIEQSNAKVRARKPEKSDLQYGELMKELSNMKQELARLKLDVASALDAKAKAEKEIEAANSKANFYLDSAEQLSRELEEVDEEHVLVELAKIEAERELRDIENQRKAETAKFSKEMEATRKKMKELRKEIERSKELEAKLATTNADLNVLQNEMELVRAMERNFKKYNPEPENSSLLESAEAELKAAKTELEKIREEGFQFMSSMDAVRQEMARIAWETERLKKQEKKADSAVLHLNSKLLKAKLRLEAAVMADERAEAIVCNLSAAHQELQREIEAAKREKESAIEETKSIKMKIDLTDSDTRLAEERLQSALQEIEAVKRSEAVALRKLRRVSERTMKDRASSSVHSATMTISKCEYDYLRNRAASAQLVADKKVAAAQAWIEALKAEEKEILMKSKLVEKEIQEIRAMEERENCKEENSFASQRSPEVNLHGRRKNEEDEENLNLQLSILTPPRKSMKESGLGSRRVKIRRSAASAGIRNSARSPSFTVRKRHKAMPNLVKFLKSRSNGIVKLKI